MKHLQNAFEILGLDPYTLRRFPDEVVGKIVKVAYRALILSVHEDIGKHSARRDLAEEAEDKSTFFTSKHRTDEQSVRYEDVMDAYTALSTPKGRYLAFQKLKGKKEGDWKERIKEAESKSLKAKERVSEFSLNFALNSVGALETRVEDNIVKLTPLHFFYGGRLLVSANDGSNELYEICLSEDGWATSISPCKLVNAKMVSFPKKQPWFFKAKPGGNDYFAIPQKEVVKYSNIRLVGMIDRDVYDHIARRPQALIKGSGRSKTLPKTSVPFPRINKSEIGNLLDTLSVDTSHQHAIVLCDVDGNFYFPGVIRNSVLAKIERK